MTPEAQHSHAALDVISAYSKLTIDWMKHLMQMSVGIIVVVTAFRDHVNKGALVIWALPLSMVCLLACVLCAMRVCFDLVYNEAHNATIRAWALTGQATPEQVAKFKQDADQYDKKDRRLKRFLFWTNLMFASGVMCIVFFVVTNFLLLISIPQ